jgi:predicted short-subunit dehydrogenase-like oxidoreductase (DUF2520 family)
MGKGSVTGGDGDHSPSLRTFCRLFPDARVAGPADVADGADLVLVTTPDDRVEEVVRRIAAVDGFTPGQRVVHASGGLAVDVLGAARAAGAAVAACHPAMTFPDVESGADALPGTSWAVTAAEADLGWARVLVVDLGGSPVTLAAKDRTLYHAGLSVGSNGTTAVVSLARDMLLGAGIDDPAAFLTPLVITSARGGADRGVDALTGPVRRGDAGTVSRHLQELATSFPEAVEAYLALGELILAQAVRAGLDPQRAADVRKALDAVRG